MIIDHFSRCIELFPSKDATAKSAANALHRHICRFGVRTELVTDQGTQFVNETLTEYLNVAGIHIQKKKTVLFKGKIKKLIDIYAIIAVIFDTRVI